jgi:hypothetical protein
MAAPVMMSVMDQLIWVCGLRLTRGFVPHVFVERIKHRIALNIGLYFSRDDAVRQRQRFSVNLRTANDKYLLGIFDGFECLRQACKALCANEGLACVARDHDIASSRQGSSE